MSLPAKKMNFHQLSIAWVTWQNWRKFKNNEALTIIHVQHKQSL